MVHRSEKGIVLFIVLGLVLLVAVAVSTTILVSTSEIKMTRRQSDSTKAFYLAEAGIHRARTQLSLDWSDRDAMSNIGLGDGTYSVNIYDTDSVGSPLPTNQLRVESTGNVEGISRRIETILENTGDSSHITNAIEMEGSLDLRGSAEVNGSVVEGATLSFEDVFGMDKSALETIAQNSYPATYYSAAFNNDTAAVLTWVSAPGEESQITINGWTGDGILVVEGNLKITGGTFNGIIWVIGVLTVSGNPIINGAIFVESGVAVDTTVTGTAEINFDASAVESAFTVLAGPPEIQSWREAP